ncbi:MAG: O-antigen ligase family protein [Lachnospiraceae bacterium]|jgi:hypothetical protein|nr:O-antigen ligase family protein [Lachnospiraceae bacterium]
MRKKNIFLYWIIMECFLSIAIAAMLLTGGSLSQFYNSEYEAVVNKKQYLLLCIELFFVISILSFLFSKKIERLMQKGRCLLNKIIIGYEKCVDCILKYIKRVKGNARLYAIGRSLSIIFILMLGYLAHMAGARKSYGYTVIFFISFMCILVFWIVPKRQAFYKVNRIKKLWWLLCIIQFISDIIIQKRVGFVELWMLSSFGLLYRTWERMEKPEQLWDDFANGIEFIYILTISYCVFIEPWWKEEILYSGMWKNPNPFSVMIVLCLLVIVYRCIQVVSSKSQYWKLILYFGEIIVGIKMITLSQCRTAILSCTILFIWCVLFILGKKMKHIKFSARNVVAILSLVFLIVCSILIFKGGMILSKKSTSITLDDMTSGRLTIWKEYIMQMNLWGHGDDALVNGTLAYAHNMILKFTYTYGLIAGVVVIMLLVEVCRRAFLFWEKERENENAFLVIGILLVYFISTMIESVDDLPMVWQIWSAFYFVLGFLMLQCTKEGNSG